MRYARADTDFGEMHVKARLHSSAHSYTPASSLFLHAVETPRIPTLQRTLTNLRLQSGKSWHERTSCPQMHDLGHWTMTVTRDVIMDLARLRQIVDEAVQHWSQEFDHLPA